NFAVMDGTLTFVPTTVNAQFSLVGGSDAMGIHYYTPNIAGFSAGISYHPQLATDASSDAQATGGNNDADIIAIGAQYANSFGDFDFAIGGGYVTLDGDAISEAVTAPAGGGALITTETRTDLESDAWGVGVEVGFAGFGIQGRYEELDAEEDGVDSADVQAYQIGATYGTGPWTFGAGYGHWEDDETDAEDSTIKGGVTYSLGKGVTLGGVIEWGEADDGTEEEDGVAGAILLGVSF
ncbi:MAG: porin, partial [Pseudomonadota bacterium]